MPTKTKKVKTANKIKKDNVKNIKLKELPSKKVQNKTTNDKTINNKSKECKPCNSKFQDKGCPKIIYVMFFFVILILAISVYQYQYAYSASVNIVNPATDSQPDAVVSSNLPSEVEPVEIKESQPSSPVEISKELYEQPTEKVKKDYTIYIKERKFIPQNITIPWSSKVTFVNEDNIAHTVLGRTRPYDDKRSIHLEPMKPGQESTYIFQRTGEYEIYSGTIASIKMYITVK